MPDLKAALRAKIKSLRSEHAEEKGLWYHGLNCGLLLFLYRAGRACGLVNILRR